MFKLLSQSMLAVGGLSLMLSPVMAQPPGGERGRPGGRGQGRPGGAPPPIVVALDVNKDGKIDASELDNAVAALRSLDKNGDGDLTMEELRPTGGRQGNSMRRRGEKSGEAGKGSGKRGGGKRGGENRNAQDRDRRSPEMMAKFFDKQDKNGDGSLSGDEIPERMAARLEKIDANSDGEVSKEEFTSMMSKARGKSGKKRGRGGESRNPGGDKPKRPAVEA